MCPHLPPDVLKFSLYSNLFAATMPLFIKGFEISHWQDKVAAFFRPSKVGADSEIVVVTVFPL